MKGSTAEIDVQAIKPFEALQELNRSLIKKVSQQTDLIERMDALNDEIRKEIDQTKRACNAERVLGNKPNC